MGGVDIQFKFPNWAGKVRTHRARLNLFQAAIIQTNRGMLFDAEGNYNGHQKWAPLKFRNGQILSRRGTLRKSIAPYNPRGQAGPDGIVRFAGDMIVVGTKLLYARMMNNGTVGMPGGVLRPKNAKALKIPLPSGVSASQTTRQIRSQPTEDKLAALGERMKKARERAAKARSAFVNSGSTKALNSSVNAEYRVAKLHEQIAKQRAKANRIKKTGKGGQDFLFLQSVKIPPRPFDQWNEQDQAEMDKSLMNKIAEILNS